MPDYILKFINTGLLAIVAFFGMQTYFRLNAIQKASYKHDKEIARIKQHCKDLHGTDFSED